MRILKEENWFILDYKFHPRINNAIKNELPAAGKTFDWRTKRWKIHVSQVEALKIFAKKYRFSWALEEEAESVPEILNYDMPDLAQEIPLKMNLFHYQRQGVQYSIDKKRVIIGDKMGLGKTCQGIAAVTGADAFPCLVICPSTLKTNWQREWEKWTNKRARIIDESLARYMTRMVETDMVQVFIVNYESLKKYFVESITKTDGKFTLKNVKFKSSINLFKSVILDESHRCKDFKTQATKFAKGICAGKEFIYALTGTPVVNKPKDLMPQLGIIDRLNDLGGYKKFLDRYCAGQNEASNLKELNWRLMNTCFYSRNKEDVLKDLPAKIRQRVYCDLSEHGWQEYNDAINDLEGYLVKYREADDEKVQKSMRGEVMVRIGILKDIAARNKLAGGVREFIHETTVENGEKLVLFAHQHKIFDQLHAWFPNAVSVTGRDSMDDRQAAIDKFQNDPACKLILCSIQAAGVGITLTASSRVAFVELGWHSAIHDQAEDRCHRIGQKDSVSCTYFLAKDTIDEWVFDIIERKRQMVADITGGNLDVVEQSVVENIIELFNTKKEMVA